MGVADCVCGGPQKVHVPLLEELVWDCDCGVHAGVVIGQDDGVTDIVVVEPVGSPEVVLAHELG